ncbi:potassium/proton antiporter [Prevotella sp. KH2C16]|uniref:potassium/proton antiporter n=1 Tax=Prevotella sp. KH2C16 TaxID=1855325 RepID=UPI0008F1E094|nr:potassium/proton antiporter [Prevotella sp. KH2C16]SFG15154.1 potassium/proton antiporter, CPA1 family [Prevotella sp. KH2C16]
MTLSTENIFLLGSILVLVSILISKTGYRFGIPTLLLFLFTGMIFGSDGVGIEFDSLHNAQNIGMLSLSVILFTGGMDTRIKDIRPVLGQGLLLSTLGVVLTTLLTGLFIFFITSRFGLCVELSLIVSLLLAATMSSTDSASVFSLLRSQGIGLKHHLRPILELESGSNDPMAYMLTLALVGVAVNIGHVSASGILAQLALQFMVGGVVGWLMGMGGSMLINRINLPNTSLYPVLLLSIVVMTYPITDLLHGNGYLAVYIAGLVVGNRKLSYRREMTTFMDGLTWLLQVVMFLTLGLLVNPNEMIDIIPLAVAIGLFMMFVARPVTVWLCLLPYRGMPRNAKHFLSWVGLRGAVPIIFATYPMLAGLENSHILFNIVFFITLMSLSLQGTTISWLARRLHLDCEEEKPSEFGIEIPEEIGSRLCERKVTPEMLTAGNTISEMNFGQGTLIMLVKRGDSYIVPNGQLELHPDDVLLSISLKE